MDLGNFKIYRKEGWILNPNDKIVNGIMKGVARNDGHARAIINTPEQTMIFALVRHIWKKIVVAVRFM